MNTSTKRFIATLCIYSLLHPTFMNYALAITNDGYQGTSISGRSSVAIVGAPGGTKVNTFLGSLFLTRTDLRIPGRGLPMEIALTYNANDDDVPSAFGFGWRFSYNMSYRLEPDLDVVITWGDGRTDLFDEDGGTYTPVNEGVFATLEQYEPDKYRVTTKEQIQFFFEDATHKRLTKIQDPNGNALTFGYNAGGQLTTITDASDDASGRSLTLSYTGGKVTTITDPNAEPDRTLQYGYDGNGDQVSFTDPLGNITTYAYDTHRLTKITDPLGMTDITYGDPNLTVTSVGRSTLAGDLLSMRSFAYDTVLRITTVTDTINDTTTAARQYIYDANNRLEKTIDSLGHEKTRTYDAEGNIASITDANGHPTSYTYDARGNVLTITDALEHTTEVTYHSVCNKVETITDANEHTTMFAYDSRCNRMTRTDPLGNVTAYTYDEFGQLVNRTNAAEIATGFEYDSFGNRTKIISPASGTTSFTYDEVGNQKDKTDAKGQTTAYTYDSVNRLTKVVYPDSTEANLTYDQNGNLLTAMGPNTNLAFLNDANGRLLQVTDNLLSKTISYQNDGVGNRIRMTDPEGTVTDYSYDLANRLDVITRDGQLYNFDYDDGDRLTKLTLPNGSVTDYGHNDDNTLASLVNRKSDGTVISSFDYAYDDGGINRTKLTLAGGEQIDYSYDAADQLTGEVSTGGASNYDHKFTYASVGNRTEFDADGVITSYVYDGGDRLTQETTGATVTGYTYDNNGNLIEKTTGGSIHTYTYDPRDRLTAFTSPTSSASYIYDVFGRRITKSVNGTTTQFVYNDHDVVAEYDGGGVLQAQYLFGLGIDQNLAKLTGAESFYYLSDGLNSIRNIIDETETVQNSYDYDAWGIIRTQVEDVANDYTFTGRQADDESGLYYYRARMYDPSVGRFTQVDRINDNTGRSSYFYVENNPVNKLDPSGLIGRPAAYVIIHSAVTVGEALYLAFDIHRLFDQAEANEEANEARRQEYEKAKAEAEAEAEEGASNTDNTGDEKTKSAQNGGGTAGGGCAASVALVTPVVKPGELLEFTFELQHNRAKTVHKSLSMWIEGPGGTLIASQVSEVLTFHPGDEISLNESFALPATLAPGRYRLAGSISGMVQGTVSAKQAFRVTQ